VVDDDGRRVAITLREGLAFHDGAPVLARDAVASLRRWQARNPFGQKLAVDVDELSAPDDRTIVYRLKKPFPLLFHALASISQGAFVMPERVARTDPFKQLDDPTGSGPFRFKRDEFNSGSRMVYERNPAYRPAGGPASLTAGGKQVHFDRVEWSIIPDAATAAAALQQGEIDWFEQPPPELQQLMRRNRAIQIAPIDPLPLTGILRLNHLHPPFDDKAMRQALLPAIVQSDFMAAVVGTDPSMIRDRVGVFTPGAPMANEAGMDALLSPRSLDRAKALLAQAGYRNQPVRLIGPTDILAPTAMTQVAGDLFRRLGLNLDLALSDWGTVIQRRASREPLDKGGWSALLTSFSSYDFMDPALHPLIRGNGLQGWPGWPTIPRLETLRDAWFDAPDEAGRKAIAQDIQRTVLDEVAYIPVGGYQSMTALRSNLAGRVDGFAIFWGLHRA
jgi:ABC-type transport system substrate-binding protein